MKHHFWIVILAVLLTSCNLNAVQETATLLSTPTPVSSPTSFPTPTIIPIETLLARDTPTVAPTATSRLILASPKDQPVNCRFGPNVSYSVTGALAIGRQAEVIGKSIDETWWYVKNPSDPSTNCWLSGDFIIVVGNVEALSVVSPPEIGVTNINVQVDPVLMNVGCAAFPQIVNLTAQITVNGPTIITWKWETSAGDVFPEETLLFESEGIKEVRKILTVWSANDYWVNLHVLIPNDRSGGANFKVTCVP
ncbi:MAG TPA: hypothetical protein VLA72_01335 [Anaerolineales bacterium]|nr:hypothetical protein [Anaerolineales bacterium]